MKAGYENIGWLRLRSFFFFFPNSKLCINRVYLKVHRVEFEAKMFFVSQYLLCVSYLGIAKRCILPVFQFVKLSFS